ncbi:MAG: DarT ssDNA thymidine ADP-ribosyltransferase family protein [Candidatus Sulfotelmatobacter sp.]
MTILDIIKKRGITEVLHFTTHRGLLGSLHSGAVKSRERLPAEVNLKFIYKPNAIYRKDPAWLDYVNLSISRINSVFFATSCRWHRAEDLWWCIMSFDPEILTHSGVYFATTNNMYTGFAHGAGAAGVETLFAARVVRYNGNIAVRTTQLADNFTTCVQAEALYPGELSVEYLRRVYVETNEDQDEVYAQMHMVGVFGVDVIIDPKRFR